MRQTGTYKRGHVLGQPEDTFLAAIRWTKRRTAVVFHRRHAGREFVRIRTFHRNQLKDVWYPSQRFYLIPIESAEELGKAIIAASKGERYGPVPDWWPEFEQQYEAYQRGSQRRKERREHGTAGLERKGI